MALVLAGCGDSNDGGGGVKTLKYTEQVWTTDAEGTLVAYNGTITVAHNAGGAASIADGILNLNVEKPVQTSLKPMNTFLSTINDKFKIFSGAGWDPSSPTPNAMELILTNLNKMNSITGDDSSIEETVRYIYVDRDCKLTAASKANVAVTGVSVPVNVSALNLSLTEGWNIIKTQMEFTSTGGTASIKIGDLSSCKWTLTIP